MPYQIQYSFSFSPKEFQRVENKRDDIFQKLYPAGLMGKEVEKGGV